MTLKGIQLGDLESIMLDLEVNLSNKKITVVLTLF